MVIFFSFLALGTRRKGGGGGVRVQKCHFLDI